MLLIDEKIILDSVTKIADDNIVDFFEIIDHCEFARFAPSDEVSEASPVYEKASRIISKFEQNFK